MGGVRGARVRADLYGLAWFLLCRCGRAIQSLCSVCGRERCHLWSESLIRVCEVRRGMER